MWADGAYPYATLVLRSNTLYGTTSEGGSSGWGTVFQLNTDGKGFTTLKNFAYSIGAELKSRLLLDGGTLYGTTSEGGDFGIGAVFKIDLAAFAQPVIGPGSLSDGLFGFLVSGPPGADYAVQATTNLATGDWTTIFRTNSPPIPFRFTDPNPASNGVRFYRAVTGSILP